MLSGAGLLWACLWGRGTPATILAPAPQLPRDPTLDSLCLLEGGREAGWSWLSHLPGRWEVGVGKQPGPILGGQPGEGVGPSLRPSH